MKKPALEIVEKNSKHPELVLIFDRKGDIGESLIKSLQKTQEELQIVFATKSISASFVEKNSLVFMVPLTKKIPTIPDGEYAYMIVVFNGEKEDEDILRSCVKKAESTKARLVVVVELRNPAKEKTASILNGYKNAATVFVGDYFSNYLINTNTMMNRFLLQAKKTGRIRVANTGLEKLYPVFLDDVTEKVLEVLLGTPSNTKHFFVFPKYPPTQLSLAHMIQKIDPLIKVDFVKEREKETEEVPLPKEGKYLMPEEYALLERLKDVFAIMSEENFSKTKANAKDISLNNENNIDSKKQLVASAILFIFSLLVLPGIVLLFFSSLALWEINGAKSTIEKGNFNEVLKKTARAHSFFSIAKQASRVVMFETTLVRQEQIAMHIEKTIDMGIDASMMIASLAFASQKFMQGEDLVSASNALKQGMILLQKIQVEQKDIVGKFIFPTKIITATVDVFPDLLGFQKKREYLVLFQNNMELRPGGGFIGSYGLLTIDKGRVIDFSIHDVYDADGQMKGHVEPPFPIRRYLASQHWYLRDSNWNIDFPKSAAIAAHFLDLETGKTVDGVIAIDVSFIKKILKALGPIYVADYNQTVNAENLYEVTQKHAEQDFFPGSTQKKDFLRSLFTSIRESILSKKQMPYITLVNALQEAILQKHLLFAFADASAQNVFTANSMSSSLWDSRSAKQNELNDFLGINEANLGVNKVNYLVTRSIDHAIVFEKEKGLVETVTIQYNNSGGKDYKNYLRVIVPSNAKLLSVAIDGKKQATTPAITDFTLYEAKKFLAPKELEIEENHEEQKTTFGFLIIIPQNTTKTVAVSYTPFDASLFSKPSFQYSLRVFKQPGTDEYPYSLTFSPPDTFAIIDASQGIKTNRDNLTYKATLSQDMDLSISLAKK